MLRTCTLYQQTFSQFSFWFMFLVTFVIWILKTCGNRNKRIICSFWARKNKDIMHFEVVQHNLRRCTLPSNMLCQMQFRAVGSPLNLGGTLGRTTIKYQNLIWLKRQDFERVSVSSFFLIKYWVGLNPSSPCISDVLAKLVAFCDQNLDLLSWILKTYVQSRHFFNIITTKVT